MLNSVRSTKVVKYMYHFGASRTRLQGPLSLPFQLLSRARPPSLCLRVRVRLASRVSTTCRGLAMPPRSIEVLRQSMTSRPQTSRMSLPTSMTSSLAPRPHGAIAAATRYFRRSKPSRERVRREALCLHARTSNTCSKNMLTCAKNSRSHQPSA